MGTRYLVPMPDSLDTARLVARDMVEEIGWPDALAMVWRQPIRNWRRARQWLRLMLAVLFV